MYREMGSKTLSEWLLDLEEYILEGSPDLSGAMLSLRADFRIAVDKIAELERENEDLNRERSWRLERIRDLEQMLRRRTTGIH